MENAVFGGLPFPKAYAFESIGTALCQAHANS